MNANRYIGPLQLLRHPELCTCDGNDQFCQDDRCLNRASLTECGLYCRAGVQCKNRRIQNREFANTYVAQSAGRGQGLFAASAIVEGDLVCEYVGDVFDNALKKQLQAEGPDMSYVFELQSNTLFIDALHSGQSGRYINHSCDPNCTATAWIMPRGERRMIFFAHRKIEVNEEITFDYRRHPAPGQTCICGAHNCKYTEPETVST
jgi:histone-lysine N-methyltransferase SETD2